MKGLAQMSRRRQSLSVVSLLLLGSMACAQPLTPTLSAIDQSTQAPLVSNVSAGAIVELWLGAAAQPALLAASPSVAVGSTVTRVPLPHRLSPGQTVRARQRYGFLKLRISDFGNPVIVENNYATNRYDSERTGWNPNESRLTVSAVRNNLSKVCEHPVDTAIRAQPLYVQNVEIPGKGRHDVVYVATEGNQVWAFDAASCLANDQGLWVDAAGRASPRKLLGAGENIPGTGGVPAKCGLRYGIWSTPVIDRTTNTMYVVASVGKATGIFFRLHALDIRTGQDQAPPVVIDGSTVHFTHGNVTTSLDPSVQQNRPALLLDRGVVYVGFGSCGDVGAPYHGWIVAYDAGIPGSSTFFTQLGVFNASAEATGGCNTTSGSPPCMAGIWQSGQGLAADGDGTVYAITGNGAFDPGKGSYGNTVVRLRLPPTASASPQMQLVNFFTPFDWRPTYEIDDNDFGAGGPVLFASGSRRFLLAQGKPRKAYLIDRNCPTCDGNPNRCIPVTGQACNADDPGVAGVAKSPVIQTLTQTDGIAQGMVAGPAYYVGPQGSRIYYGFNFSPMTVFDFAATPALLSNPRMATDSAPYTSPIPVVSSNGQAPGTGILWAVFPSNPSASEMLTLHAYDANNITDNLFSSSAQKSMDIAKWAEALGNSFQVPTVSHGMVYIGSQDRLVVFGLRPRIECSRVLDCGGSVTFQCTREPNLRPFRLERLVQNSWKNVTGAESMNELPRMVYLWDYPEGDSATYRVCSSDFPEGCTSEFAVKLNRLACGLGPDAPCGRVGTPPCFFNRTLPQSRRNPPAGTAR